VLPSLQTDPKNNFYLFISPDTYIPNSLWAHKKLLHVVS
jgi:hypothetical protein